MTRKTRFEYFSFVLWNILLSLLLKRSIAYVTTKHHKMRAFSARLRSVPSPDLFHSTDYDYEILSKDPLVYVVKNLLSRQECCDYIEHVQMLNATNRKMTQSNPPELSIDTSKLWPLPFLSLVAGIPPWLHSSNDATIEQIVANVLPAVGMAFLGSILLTILISQALTKMNDNNDALAALRTSEAMALNLPDDCSFIAPLVNRASVVAKHSWEAWEAPVVTHYRPGSVFRRHNDASPTRGSEWEGGQRVVTVIVYLNGKGGATYFDQLDLTVTPQQGSALVFFPCANRQSLEADDRTTHESLMSGAEEKWIVQLFGRIGPRVPPPLGIPNEFSSQSTSE